MKKRLRPILIAVPLLIAALIIGIFLFRHRTSGEILLNQVIAVSSDTYLVQVREVGARQIKLADGTASRITYSPNGRYLAFVQNGFETLLFDTNRPRRAALRLDRSVVSLLPLDDGSLLYVVGNAVYRTDGKQTTLVAEGIRYLESVSGGGSAVYGFAPAETDYNLCRVSLSDGSVEVLLEQADKTSLQVATDETGQDILICAQSFTYEFCAYDVVRDDLAEADAASTDEEAIQRNEIRTQLKEKTMTATGQTVWRIAGDERQKLAEGVQGTYYCEPISGLLVYHLCRPFADPIPIETLREARLPDLMQWHFCQNGSVFTPPELNRAFNGIQLSARGAVAILKNNALYLWQAENGSFGAPEMIDAVQDYCLVRRADGTDGLYYKTLSGDLCLWDETGSHTLSTAIESAHLPCRVLPDGTKQLICDMVYYIHMDDPGQRRDDPQKSSLHLLQNGERTVVTNITDSSGFYNLQIAAAAMDGSLLAKAGYNPTYVLSPSRTDRLPFRYNNYSLCPGWEGITLETLQ